ncbi:hypothetical protein LINGRAHAP2_LOCUS2246, partial [Linum grandiflorum]
LICYYRISILDSVINCRNVIFGLLRFKGGIYIDDFCFCSISVDFSVGRLIRWIKGYWNSLFLDHTTTLLLFRYLNSLDYRGLSARYCSLCACYRGHCACYWTSIFSVRTFVSC